MSRQICCLVIALVAVHAAPAAASSIVLIDTFEDGTTQGWGVPGPSNNPPVNESTGGPDGLDDGFLLVTAVGGSGPGSRLSVINFDQWTFDYLAAGTDSISMDLVNLGPEDLYLRLLFADPLGGPPSNIAISSDAIFLPAGGGWTSVVFPIAPADLLALFGSVTGALTGPTEIRIFHNFDPEFGGPPAGIPSVNAQLGIDNIQAVVSVVPEPATALLFGIGAAALTWRRHRHRRSDRR